MTAGAAGIAILAARPAAASDGDAVKEARRLGYSLTRGELQKGAVGIASALLGTAAAPLPFEACVGVVAMEDLDSARCARLVTACARALAAALARGRAGTLDHSARRTGRLAHTPGFSPLEPPRTAGGLAFTVRVCTKRLISIGNYSCFPSDINF